MSNEIPSDDVPDFPVDMPDDVAREFCVSLVIALLHKQGGHVTIDIGELDGLTHRYFFGYRVKLPNAPTGDLHVDARVGGKIELSLRLKT